MEKFKHSGKISLGLSEITHPQGCSGWAKSRSSYLETPNNPAYIFFILGNEQGAIQIIQPTSCFFLGLSWAFPLTNPFPGPTGVLCPLSNLILFLDFPRPESTLPCHHFCFYCTCLNIEAPPLAHLDFYCTCPNFLSRHLVSTVHVLGRGISPPPPSNNTVPSWELEYPGYP